LHVAQAAVEQVQDARTEAVDYALISGVDSNAGGVEREGAKNTRWLLGYKKMSPCMHACGPLDCLTLVDGNTNLSMKKEPN